MHDANPYAPTDLSNADTSPHSQLFGDTIHASITMSPDFLIETLNRFRALNRLRRLWMRARWVAAFLLLLVVCCAVFMSQFLIAVGLAAFVFITFSPNRIDDWLARRRLAKSPAADEVFVIEITDAGYHSVSNRQDTMLFWTSFSFATIFDDGILYYQTQNAVNWLPWRSLKDPADAERLRHLTLAKFADNHAVHTERRSQV